MYDTADEAQLKGNRENKSGLGMGVVDEVSVEGGETVSDGQTIGTVTPASTAPISTKGVSAVINVTSPISGTVVQVPAVTGQEVTPGLPIVQLTDLSQVNVIAYVNEGAINNISNGQGVDITVDAYSGTSFSGHVQQIVQATAGQFSLLPTQDNASGNFTKVGQRVPVLITLDGTGWKDLIPGMSAEVTIHLH